MSDLIGQIEERKTSILIGILVTGLILRVYISFFSGLTWWNTDTHGYFFMASQILAGTPISDFPNGFPLLIAFFSLFTDTNTVPVLLVIVNILINTYSVYLIYKILERMNLPVWGALAGAFLFAIAPNQINFTRQLMTDIPSAFLLLASFYFLISNRYFLSGTILALAILFRSSLLPIAGGWLLIAFFIQIKLSWQFITGLVTIWLVNYSMEINKIIQSPSNFGQNILISTQTVNGRVNFDYSSFSEAEVNNPVSVYFSALSRNPGQFASERFYSFNELWGWPNEGDINNPRSVFTQLAIFISRFPFFILSLFSVFLIGKISDSESRLHLIALFIPIGLLTVIHTLLFSMPRFTIPMEAFAIMGSVYFLSFIWGKK